MLTTERRGGRVSASRCWSGRIENWDGLAEMAVPSNRVSATRTLADPEPDGRPEARIAPGVKTAGDLRRGHRRPPPHRHGVDPVLLTAVARGGVGIQSAEAVSSQGRPAD